MQIMLNICRLCLLLLGYLIGGSQCAITPQEVIEQLQKLWSSIDGPNWNYPALRTKLATQMGIAKNLNGTSWSFAKDANGAYGVDPCNINAAASEAQRLHFAGLLCSDNAGLYDVTAIVLPGASHRGGKLPDDLLLPNVKYLDLSYNSLLGSVPNTLQTMLSLASLYLGNNPLMTGSVPEWLWSKASLVNLDLQNCGLSGTISSSINALTKLSILDLHGNKFIGTLPPLSAMDKLRVLDVSANALTGPLTNAHLPSTLEQSPLFSLNVGKNSFSGTLPTLLGQLSNLTLLDISYNQFTGTLPSTLNGLHKLYMLELQHNYLETPSNGNFLNGLVKGGMPFLSIVDASYNRFTGSLGEAVFSNNVGPASTNPLTVLNVGSNCFSGTLPSNLCDASKLQVLVLSEMTGGDDCRKQFWADTAYADMFNGFDYKSYVSGVVPQCIFKLKNISQIYMSGIGVTGALPDTVGEHLTTVQLSRNKYLGTIPSSFLSSQIQDLELSQNFFTGDLNEAQGNMFSDSFNLDLSRNMLSGTVPKVYREMRNVDILTGNVFRCDDSTALPESDPSFTTYACAQPVFNPYTGSILVVTGILCVLAGFGWYQNSIESSYFHCYFSKRMKEIRLWYNISLPEEQMQKETAVCTLFSDFRDNKRYRVDPPLSLLGVLRMLSSMKFIILYTGIGIFVVFMTLYGALWAPSSRSLTHGYLWSTTAGYLYGQLAAILCAILYLIAIVSVRDIMVYEEVKQYNIKRQRQEGVADNRASSIFDRHSPSFSDSFWMRPSSPSMQLDTSPFDRQRALSLRESKNTSFSESAFRPRSASNRPASPSPTHSPDPTSGASTPSPDKSPDLTEKHAKDAIPSNDRQSRGCIHWCWAVLLPSFRLLVLFSISLTAIVLVNVGYTLVYLHYDVKAKALASIGLSIVYIKFDMFLTFLFGNQYFRLGTSMRDTWALTAKLWGGMVPLKVLMKILNSLFVPCITIALLDPTCFNEQFIAAAPYIVNYPSWTCPSAKFDLRTNTCLEIAKSEVVQTMTNPFNYTFTCSSSFFRAYIPVYLGEYSLRLIALCIKLVLMFVVAVDDPAPTEHGTSPRLEKSIADTSTDLVDRTSFSASTDVTTPTKSSDDMHFTDVVPPATADSSASKPVDIDHTNSKDANASNKSSALGMCRAILPTFFTSRRLLWSFQERKHHLQNGSVLRVNAEELLSTSINHFVLIASIGIFIPLLALVMTLVGGLEAFVDQLVLGRFIAIETSAVILASENDISANVDSETAFQTTFHQKQCQAVVITREMLDGVQAAHGAIAALTAAEEECASFNTANEISKCKQIYVFLASMLCAFVTNDIYNSGRVDPPSYIITLIVLFLAPVCEMLILIVKCYDPTQFNYDSKVSDKEHEHFKEQLRLQRKKKAVKSNLRNKMEDLARRTSPTLSTKFFGRNALSPPPNEQQVINLARENPLYASSSRGASPITAPVSSRVDELADILENPVQTLVSGNSDNADTNVVDAAKTSDTQVLPPSEVATATLIDRALQAQLSASAPEIPAEKVAIAPTLNLDLNAGRALVDSRLPSKRETNTMSHDVTKIYENL